MAMWLATPSVTYWWSMRADAARRWPRMAPYHTALTALWRRCSAHRVSRYVLPSDGAPADEDECALGGRVPQQPVAEGCAGCERDALECYDGVGEKKVVIRVGDHR